MTTDERLQKVEGQLARVRWINRCLIASIVLSVGVWFIVKTLTPEMAWAQSAVKEIRANKFVLEDENGKDRASIAMDRGGPGLSLMDENGKTLATMTLGKDGRGLRLMDENSNTRAVFWLSVLANQPSLVLKDENGKSRAVLTVSKDGPRLELRDENGKPIWSAP